MRGKDIPLITWYRITDKGTERFKQPMYKLESADAIKAKQDKLGKNASWYYGTHCQKCCGVYPAFQTENTFDAYGYYVCLVCGKESEHEPMSWQAAQAWNEGRYKWAPSGSIYEQLTLEEVFGWSK